MSAELRPESGAIPRARRTIRRVRWLPAVVAGSAILLAGAAPAAASPRRLSATHGSIAITLWESHNGGPVGNAMSALVARFDRTHKGSVKVTIVVTKASTKLLAAIPAGTAPALAEISHYDSQLVQGGALVSWNRFIKGSTTITKRNFTPAVWDNGMVKGQHYRIQADVKLSQVGETSPVAELVRPSSE